MPKSIIVRQWGGSEVMQLEEVAKPTPKDGEVLIRVRAASINPLDWKIRSGARANFAKLPYYPGCDVAGDIEAVGAGVTAFKAGDAVYSMIGRDRGYAEYATARAVDVAAKPATLDYSQAAAVPLAALTAWQMLFDNGNLTAGQRVLVHAAAGGVGGYAVQLARHFGGYVIGTASARNHEYLKSLGAHELIDYNTTKFEEVVKDIDLVVDLMSGDTQARSWKIMKPGAMLVCAAGAPNAEAAKAAGMNAKQQSVHPDGAQLKELSALIDSGKVKVEVAATFPLAKAGEAHTLSATGHVRGKIVLTV